ncbi:MAG: hypothetical protein JXO48_10390 [Deltaproteobacteria bacterium]|nr:hypothetical protein [Deltaproteobacteria bacterium]
MKRRAAAGALMVLVLLFFMATVTAAAVDSPDMAGGSGNAVEGERVHDPVTPLRVISVIVMALFLAWYIRRKMKL